MTTERSGNTVRYGRINKQMIGSWLQLDPSEDGPFGALNLMKYRDVAEYADGRAGIRTGREADDEYTPRESLAAIGADIVFAADVERISVGDGTEWDRIGIVRYPSRRRFLEVQQREEFKKAHIHKDAGMDFTIVMSCLPRAPFDGSTKRHPRIELSVTSDKDQIVAGPGGATFDVEGVIVGDERVWTRASFRWLDGEEAPPAGRPTRASEAYVMILRPSIDRLTNSVHK